MGVTKVWLFTILVSTAISLRCDRTPFGSSMANTQADGRFVLSIIQADNTYIPDQLYKVHLESTDDVSMFSAFMISAEGELQPDPRNPRKLISKYAGLLRPHDDFPSRFSDRCHNSLEQTNAALKTNVDVYWQAPPSGNGCVTIRAMVAENEEVWFVDGAPLTKRVCEDSRQPDDIATAVNENCEICDDAKYEVMFTGIWSRNTHPQKYPENDWVPRYSDLIGASHNENYILWSPGTLATPGLRNLAEHANSSELETEIREKIGDGVRTLIKGKGHGYPNMASPTYAFFRVDKDHHLISTITTIHPSPDWFLGVSRFELCQDDNTWMSERELNLYPWDAGTDNGVSYESSNDETSPQDAINRVHMSSYDKNSPFYNIDMKELNPFATLHIKLIRTFRKECQENTESENNGTPDNEGENEANSETSEPVYPSRYHSPDLPSDDDSGGEVTSDRHPDSEQQCPLTQWEDWLPCTGKCINGQINGFQTRLRYHIVDGAPAEKYDEHAKKTTDKEVPETCKEQYEVFDIRECIDTCSNQISSTRRLYREENRTNE